MTPHSEDDTTDHGHTQDQFSDKAPWAEFDLQAVLADLPSRSMNLSLDFDFELTVGTVMKVFMAAIMVSAGSLALIGFGTQPALAASVTASDVSISTADGNITSVNISPRITVTWSSLDKPVSRVYANLGVTEDTSKSYGDLIYQAELDCTNTTHADCNSTSGTTTLDFPQINLTSVNAYAWVVSPYRVFNQSMFAAPEGATETTTVYVKLDVYAQDADGNVINNRTVKNQFDVSVTNEEGNVSLTGSFNSSVTG